MRQLRFICVLLLLFSCEEGELDSVIANRAFSTDEPKFFSNLEGKTYAEIQEFVFANQSNISEKNITRGEARLILGNNQSSFQYVTCFDVVFEFNSGTQYLKYIVANNERPIESIQDDLEGVGDLFYAVGFNITESGSYQNEISVSLYAASRTFQINGINGDKFFTINGDKYGVTFNNLDVQVYDYERQESFFIPDTKMSGILSCI
ncbi:MAG: hypothetical protein ABJH05_15610 [Fulvivirga sp.]